MPTDIVPLLIALAALIAFVVGVRGYFIYKSIQALADDVEERRHRLATGGERLRLRSQRLRSELAQADATIERSLWGLVALDGRLEAAAGRLRLERARIERTRVRYVQPGSRGLARVRQAVRMLRQLHEMRRTFLA